MENGVNEEDNKHIKMGASNNPNAARLAALQERKQSIEEALAKRNQELRQLCIQEAELTGVMPTEIPLEPGESPPFFRRRIGTSFQLPQNLINNLNNEDESIASLELNMQVQANMAEAALSLANESNISKTIRRQHMAQYQHHKRQYNSLEEKLAFFKTRNQMVQQSYSPLQQQKQKKKPRPSDQDDSVSMNINVQCTEPFEKSILRHSMRSLQHSYTGEGSIDERHVIPHQKLSYRNSEGSPQTDIGAPFIRPEESMVSGIYRLSLNGYKTYMERKEGGHIIATSNNMQPHFISSQSNPNLYQYQPSQQGQYSVMSHTLPHGFQRNQQPHHNYIMYAQYGPNIPQSQSLHDYTKYNISNNNNGNNMRPPSSPSSISHTNSYSKSYYPSAYYSNNRQYTNMDHQFKTLNPHQIQPHQQYEQDVMTAGLGGYWKKTESGESVWCTSSPNESWQRDKRFGSLDRRRNKRLHKRTSPLVDPKSATISVVTTYPESVRPSSVKVQHVNHGNRNRPDNRQLVRTQSLGSVGAQTVDSVWPSDDNSSCGSDAHSINELNIAVRKQKQKEWFETSLDGPLPPTPTRFHSVVSSVVTSIVPSLSPEEKYLENSNQPLQSPQTHKKPLEIPAESNPNPSPIIHERNLEMFNSIPKNGTLIQAGHCKPYHEETKPFEMSDFYKYSTKFKKSPVKQSDPSKNCGENTGSLQLTSSPVQCNLNQNLEDDNTSIVQKGIYQPLQPMKCQPYSPNNNYDQSFENLGSPNAVNTSLDVSQFTSNIAENFSAEMNAWYQSHEQKIDNSVQDRPNSSNRSTATLV